MNNGKYVFAQLTSFLPQRTFDGFVTNYHGNKYVKHFTCWHQLLCMLFGQLTNRESLRDLIVVLDAHSSKTYHLGLGKNITRSNLAKANERRDFKIFENYAFHLISLAQKKLINDDFAIQGKVYAFDSSTIDLCLNVFWWAKFRKTKGGIKLHTLYDVTTDIPAFIHITDASVHDVVAMDMIPYQQGAYYIFDRGYVDYSRLYKITKQEAYFVTRAKSNTVFRRMYSNKVDKTNGVLTDQIGKFVNYYAGKDYPEKIRRIKFLDSQTGKKFTYLTNNFDLPPEHIALLYKNRWQVELFFKWIKQHLKVKSFWGTSENAVRIQMYCAIITYCLVAIVKYELGLQNSTYEILQILGISLLDKTPINELFTKIDYKNVKELNDKQLSIRLF